MNKEFLTFISILTCFLPAFGQDQGLAGYMLPYNISWSEISKDASKSMPMVHGDPILKPAESWLKYQNMEFPQFYTLFPFDRFYPGKDDITLFQDTWKPCTFPKDMVISWHQYGILFARMGMTAEAADYNTLKLQEMLIQTFCDQILLFPAWPRDLDVDFKLHAPKNATVECQLRQGEIGELKVIQESRAKDVKIALDDHE